MIPKNKPIIAERVFFVEGFPEKKIRLKILGASSDDPDFYIDMDGVDPEKYPCMIGGWDSMQAFLQTALMLKSKIDDINEMFFDGKLRLEGAEGDDLGIYDKI